MSDFAVDYESELIAQVRARYDLKLDAVSMGTGVSVAAISRYEQGLHPVSARYARNLRMMTQGPRMLDPILQWFAPDVFHYLVMQQRVSPDPVPPVPEGSLVSQLLEALKELSDAAIEAQAIIADGRVDSADDPRIFRFRDGLFKVRERMQACDQAISAAREKHTEGRR